MAILVAHLVNWNNKHWANPQSRAINSLQPVTCVTGGNRLEPFQTRGLKTSLLSKLSVKSHVTDPLQLVEIVVGFFSLYFWDLSRWVWHKCSCQSNCWDLRMRVTMLHKKSDASRNTSSQKIREVRHKQLVTRMMNTDTVGDNYIAHLVFLFQINLANLKACFQTIWLSDCLCFWTRWIKAILFDLAFMHFVSCIVSLLVKVHKKVMQ